MIAFIQSLPVQVVDAIGVVGFGIYVINYTLLTVNVLKAEYLTYFVLNWMAATLVLIGLTSSFNLASALIQIFWIAVSTLGIIIRLRRRQPEFSSMRDREFTPS